MAGVWVLQHVEAEPPALIAEVLDERRIHTHVVRAGREPLPGSPEWSCDGVVVMGGPMGVYEFTQHAWIGGELTFLRAALHAGLPILGVCLGAQFLAAAAGARVFPGGNGREIGWGRVTLTPEGQTDPLSSVLADELHGDLATVFQWHGDTYDLPPDAVQLAASAQYPQQAFRLGTQAYGFQFHFEVDCDIIDAWLSLWAEEARSAGQSPQRIAATARDLVPHLRQRGRSVAQGFADLVERRAGSKRNATT